MSAPWTRTAPSVAEAARPAPSPVSPAEADRGYVVFEHSYLQPPGPDHVPAPATVPRRISCTLARGEYNSLLLGVRATDADLREVRLQVESDLPSRVYRPIDRPTAQMLLEQPNPVPDWIHSACLDESNEIALIAEGQTSFFWITLHAPETTAPGRHTGQITIRAAGAPPTRVALDLTIRPFVLQPARIPFAPFFYYEWAGGTALPPFAQTPEWVEAIFRDMAEHSHNSVIGLGYEYPGARLDFSETPLPQNTTFSQLLPLGLRTGLFSEDIPVIHMGHNLWLAGPDGAGREDRFTVQQADEALAWYEAHRREQGWPELMIYGWDEPAYPNPVVRERFAWHRDLPVRLATAMSAHAGYGFGDFHDIWIMLGGHITPEMVAEAERLGAEVWTYICVPLAHNPLRERHYAGLYVWASGALGHTTWHHYAQGGFKLVWFREGDQRPLPLTGWEARREGVDDYRYLQMLEDALATRPQHPLAAEARQWLDGLRSRVMAVDPHQTAADHPLALDEYDRIRDQAADYLQRLGPVPADQIPPSSPTRLKDEARPFRGRSVQECLEGLQSEEVSVRRAAATALFELGPEAAPAVEALAACLADPEVRFPALRALEAIGPAARAAVAQLSPLAQHPDGFVRMGALYALGATGAPALEVLTPALRDEYYPAAQVAGRVLSALGPAALPALPVLIEMLDGPDWEQREPALKAIAGIGPQAAEAVPHILRNWQGRFPHFSYWIEPLAAIGPDAQEAVPLLEAFRADRSPIAVEHRVVHDIEAIALYALYRIRRSPQDLRELVALIGGEGGGPRDPAAALGYVEKLGPLAAPAGAQIRELLAQGELPEAWQDRLQAVLEGLSETESN